MLIYRAEGWGKHCRGNVRLSYLLIWAKESRRTSANDSPAGVWCTDVQLHIQCTTRLLKIQVFERMETVK